MRKKMRIILTLLGFFTLSLFFSSNSFAHSPGSEYTFSGATGYDSNCTYPCDGYYADHFAFWYYFKEYSPSYWYVRHAHASLKENNCEYNGSPVDTWEAERMTIYSPGVTEKYDSYIHNQHRHTTDDYAYYEEWNPGITMEKGDNMVWAYFEYILGDCTTGEKGVEVWYPKRYEQNK